MNAIEFNSGSRAPLNSQERAYEHIKSGIINYQLRPGQRLTAAALATELGISRTPVREALSRLEQERLVVRESGWGYVVRVMSFADIAHIYRVREALEVEAAHEAFPHLGQTAIDYMGSLLVRAEELLAGGRISDFLRVNRQFHKTIAKHSGNWVLQDMIRMITDRIQIVGALVIERYPQGAQEILEENQRILRALRNADIDDVEAQIRSHIKRARERVALFLKEDSEHFYVGNSAGPASSI